jgi:hypothetical protein
VERCLACEAVGVATRGALPRLRGRKGSPPVERCLACEAVANRAASAPIAFDGLALPCPIKAFGTLHSADSSKDALMNSPLVHHGLASEAALHSKILAPKKKTALHTQGRHEQLPVYWSLMPARYP